MKNKTGFLAGLIAGVAGTIYAVWHWEKHNTKKFSTIVDKYYKKAKQHADKLVAEYGPQAKEQVETIMEKTKEYLESLDIDLSKAEIDKIMKKVRSKIDKAVEASKKTVKRIKKK